jgi:hypothetical protein
MKDWLSIKAKDEVKRSLPHYENVRQRSVNDYWSSILGNLWGDRLHIGINEVFAGSISKRASNTLCALS